MTDRLTDTAGVKDLLLSLQNSGYHITTHSKTHGKIWYYGDPLYNPSSCEPDLIQSLVALQNAGFIDYDYLIVPAGNTASEIQKIAKKWCKNAVNAQANAVYNHLGQSGRYNIQRVFIDVSVHGLTYYQGVIDTAFANGDWLVFGTHSGIPSTWDSNLVTQVLQYVQQKGIEIMTLNQAMKQRRYCYDVYEMFI